jgi:SAM-dependent methyltransferase
MLKLSASGIWHSAFLVCVLTAAALAAPAARTVTWTDLPREVHTRLEAAGLSAGSFPAFLEQLARTHAKRVREGDLDHLVFYALQSRHFTKLPPIEPALSARTFTTTSQVPPDVRARVHALLRATDSTDADARLTYFRALVNSAFSLRRDREAAVTREYARAMRFLYQKEFVAQRSSDPANAVEALYHSRGFSTDTAVEAGYVVYLGLGVVKSLHADRPIRRVLIVGPGLDLAPRTGFLEEGPPESYQPWAVIDALLQLGLSRADDLEVVGGDINPRVVSHLRRERRFPPTLHLVSGIGATATTTPSDDYREYFASLGRALDSKSAGSTTADGHFTKTVRVDPRSARILNAEALDIVTERLQGGPFDLIVATNILPYFDDSELLLAIANIASMLAPGGVFLHNEPRAVAGGVTTAAGLVTEQSRQAIIATVRGAPPLGDSIWIGRKPERQGPVGRDCPRDPRVRRPLGQFQKTRTEDHVVSFQRRTR